MFGNLGFHVIWGAPIVVANEVNDVFTPVVDVIDVKIHTYDSTN